MQMKVDFKSCDIYMKYSGSGSVAEGAAATSREMQTDAGSRQRRVNNLACVDWF